MKQFYGYDVIVSEIDNRPIKSLLPKELKNRFFTEKQWHKNGKIPIYEAQAIEMHPNERQHQLRKYYFDTEVVSERLFTKTCKMCFYHANGQCSLKNKISFYEGYCYQWKRKDDVTKNKK